MEPRKSILKNYEFISSNGIPCNLGFGAYGSVQLGKCLKTGRTVAIKKINRKLAYNEVEMHMKLNHPNIIKMYESYFDENIQTTYIILEYAENGTLFDYIRENGLKNKKMIRTAFNSVCEAIDYMHSMNIMHRDIKPENILLDRNNNAKVCDFGFAAHCEPRKTVCGTVEYMSPEMILRKPYTHKIDVWGLGILFFELIEGRAPFEGQTQQQVLKNMKKPIFFSKNFTKDEIELIHRILKVDPNERPQIKDILKNSCLRARQSDETSKRSTMQQQQESPSKKKVEQDLLKKKIEDDNGRKKTKIEVVEIKNLSEGEKVQKRSSGKISVIHVRQMSESEISFDGAGKQEINLNSSLNTSNNFQPIAQKGQKISLRKAGRRS